MANNRFVDDILTLLSSFSDGMGRAIKGLKSNTGIGLTNIPGF